MPKNTQPPQVNLVPEPTWKHRNFYDFLIISPSYFKAHQFKNGMISKEEFQKIPEFKNVLDLYEIVGDVFEPVFDEWWCNKGHKLFNYQSKRNFLFKADINKSLDENIELLSEMYSQRKVQINSKASRIVFLNNKIQKNTLSQRLDLIHSLAPHSDPKAKFGFTMPAWFIAYKEVYNGYYFAGTKRRSKLMTNIRSALIYKEGTLSYPEEKYSVKKNAYVSQYITRPTLHIIGYKVDGIKKSAQQAKRYISMLVSKEKRECLLIAENAARGRFPTNEIIPTVLDFSYDVIHESIRLDRTIMRTQEFKKKYDFKGYAKKKNKKFDSKSDIDRYIDHEVEFRLLEELDKGLKPIIEKRAEDIARKKYQQLKQIGKSVTKPTQRRS